MNSKEIEKYRWDTINRMDTDLGKYKYFVTFTFRDRINDVNDGWKVLRDFIEDIKDRYDLKGWIVSERHKDDKLHYHSLIWNVEDGFREFIIEYWLSKYGYCWIEEFDGNRKVIQYMVKNLGHRECEIYNWDIIK